MTSENPQKELEQFLEQKRSKTLHIAKNLLRIEQANKRPEAGTVKELFLYYFDYFFGELCFWQGWVPVIKLGAVPHFILVFSVSLAIHNETFLLFLCLLMYFCVIALIIIMKLLIWSMKRYFSSK
ncbi:hypothetical protein [Streptococcus suis]